MDPSVTADKEKRESGEKSMVAITEVVVEVGAFHRHSVEAERVRFWDELGIEVRELRVIMKKK